jgi:thiol-disulfide isomerase/thioredoxin
MRSVLIGLVLSCVVAPVFAQRAQDGPANEKARKTYKEASLYLRENNKEAALEAFTKADKQDGGQCLACQRQMVKYGCELHRWKPAELAAEEMVAAAKAGKDAAMAHYDFAVVLFGEGLQTHKDDVFSRAHDEIAKALVAYANFPDAVLLDGRALANLQQDEAAKARFEQYLKMNPAGGPERQRVLRLMARPELARARMAPPFAITTADGTRIAMDDLQGKVVLIDFWATWCGPCREALPHIRDVARKFQGQPLVVLSVSLDSDERKWREFVAKNDMTWPQCRNGANGGVMTGIFGVNAIPHTFTIDADGVLQDEHVGDPSIEGKIKKLLARARE